MLMLQVSHEAFSLQLGVEALKAAITEEIRINNPEAKSLRHGRGSGVACPYYCHMSWPSATVNPRGYTTLNNLLVISPIDAAHLLPHVWVDDPLALDCFDC